MERLRQAAAAIRRELAVYRLVLRDRRTPWPAKALLAAAVGYLLLPFDLIPDFIPVIGYLDDAIIVPGLIVLAMRMVPPQVVADCRARVGPRDGKGSQGR